MHFYNLCIVFFTILSHGSIIFFHNHMTNHNHVHCLEKNYGIDEESINDDDSFQGEEGDRYLSYIPYYQYFENLNNNFGRNDTLSTCGYVGIGMLLTFYDSILNKNIVPDCYGVLGDDTKSFGCVYDSHFNGSNYYYPVVAYYNFLRDRLSTSLHAKLILMHKGAETSNPSVIESTYQDEFGTNLNDLSSITTEYLGEIGLNNSATLYSVSSYYSGVDNSDVFDFIEDEIGNGKPVLFSYSHHWYLAYGFDTTKYRVHTGTIQNGTGLKHECSGDVFAERESRSGNRRGGASGWLRRPDFRSPA